VLRYEELVSEPRAALPPLLQYLDVDAGDAAVAGMLDALGTEMPELARHTTSPSPDASVGR
jgi:hypothetical protein